MEASTSSAAVPVENDLRKEIRQKAWPPIGDLMTKGDQAAWFDQTWYNKTRLDFSPQLHPHRKTISRVRCYLFFLIRAIAVHSIDNVILSFCAL